MRTVNGRDRVAIAVLVVALLGGAWLALAPFVIGYQDRSAHWSLATKDDFFIGVGLVVLALATLVTFAAGTLREIARTGRHAAGSSGGSPGEPSPSRGETGRFEDREAVHTG